MSKKTILLTALLLLVLAGVWGWGEFNRKSATADELPVVETVTAQELLDAFSTDEAAATTRFVGATEQVVQVSGTIRSMEPVGADKTNVVLDTGNDLAGVVCEFTNDALPAHWRSGAAVSVKGICTGMLMDVVLVRCAAVE